MKKIICLLILTSILPLFGCADQAQEYHNKLVRCTKLAEKIEKEVNPPDSLSRRHSDLHGYGFLRTGRISASEFRFTVNVLRRHDKPRDCHRAWAGVNRTNHGRQVRRLNCR